MNTKSIEQNLRRKLAKHDMRLEKTPSRHSSRDYYGAGYMVVDGYNNTVLLGATHRPWDASLDEVSDYASALGSE